MIQGALQFFRAVRPAAVMAECSDAMMRLATGTITRDFFAQASAAAVGRGHGPRVSCACLLPLLRPPAADAPPPDR